MEDPKLIFMVDEMIAFMEKDEGLWSGFYARAIYDYVHGINTVRMEIVDENFEEAQGEQR